jgi:ribose transport system substrate-binding protein
MARANGVDVAIGILRTLAATNGKARLSDVVHQLNAPRSTIQRIARIMDEEGLIHRQRGAIATGAWFETMCGFQTRPGRAEPRRWHQRTKVLPLGSLPEEETGPLLLSSPFSEPLRHPARLGFCNAALDNAWRTALVHSVEQAASNAFADVDWLMVRHANNDAAQQVADIEELLGWGVDGLLISAVASDRVYRSIDRLTDSGIPVVLVDRGVAKGFRYTSFVTASDCVIGETMARWLVETLGGAGRIVLLPGMRDALPSERRLSAARTIFASHPRIEVLATEWTGWHADRAFEIMSGLIAAHGQAIDGVWCDSGLQSIGSMKAFLAARAIVEHIPPHTGGDLNGAYKTALRNDISLAGIDYPPSMGRTAIEVLLSTLNGLWVPRSVVVPSEIVVTGNAATASVRPSIRVEEHVRWDLPDDLILSSGLAPSYNPQTFRVHYPGNRYNRSSARVAA